MPMTMCGLRLLPPFAIARVGSSPRPLDNFTFADDKDNPLGFRTIVPAETLVVNGETGELSRHDPDGIKFKDENDRIRPVAPFLDVLGCQPQGRAANGRSEGPR
jgi:hypothetical protein